MLLAFLNPLFAVIAVVSWHSWSLVLGSLFLVGPSSFVLSPGARSRLDATNSRQHLANRRADHGVGDVIEWRGFGVYDDDAGACGLGQRDEIRHRIDLEAGTNRQKQVGLAGGAHRRLDHGGDERLTKRDCGAL